jgi:hypothetical protein
MASDKPDEQTLLLLMVIAEIVGKKSDPQAISIAYARKAQELRNKPPY